MDPATFGYGDATDYWTFVNTEGDVVRETLETVLVHELVHAISDVNTGGNGLGDDYWPDDAAATTTSGPTVDRTNLILRELGKDALQQLSYSGVGENQTDLVEGHTYLDRDLDPSRRIDTAFEP